MAEALDGQAAYPGQCPCELLKWHYLENDRRQAARERQPGHGQVAAWTGLDP
jgi:hypothetical protein